MASVWWSNLKRRPISPIRGITAKLPHAEIYISSEKIIPNILYSSGFEAPIGPGILSPVPKESSVKPGLPTRARTGHTTVRLNESGMPIEKEDFQLKASPREAPFQCFFSITVLNPPEVPSRQACVSCPLVQTIHSIQISRAKNKYKKHFKIILVCSQTQILFLNFKIIPKPSLFQPIFVFLQQVTKQEVKYYSSRGQR